MSMKCDYNESYAKIHVCDAKSVKNDIAVLNFQVEFKGLTSPEVVFKFFFAVAHKFLILIFMQMNLTHFVKVKDQYVPFGQSRTPMGPKKFCDIMDGKWGDVGTMAIVGKF